MGEDMRYAQTPYSASPLARRARYSLRFAVLALVFYSSQSPIFAAGSPSLLQEIEASEKARLAAEAALQNLRACIRNSGANQEMETDAGNWTFDFSHMTIKIPLPIGEGKASSPCPNTECKVESAQRQLNDFAAAQVSQHNRLLKQIAKLHERLNNIASCIK
jgi:hypothetical protein